MLRLISSAICFVLVLAMLLPATSAWGRDGLDYLPEDIQGLLIVRDLASMYGVLGVTELRKERPELFREIDSELEEDTGFNPLDMSSLDRLGLQTGQPMYLAWLPDPSDCVVALLPGGEDLIESFRKLLEDEEQPAGVVDRDGDLEFYGDPDDEVVFFHEGPYLFIVTVVDDEKEMDTDDDPQSALAAARAMRQQAKKKTLKKSERYRLLSKKIRKQADVQIYFGEEMNEELLELSEDEEMSEHGMSGEELVELYEKWGVLNSATLMEATVGADRIEVEGFTWVDGKSVVRDWYSAKKDPRKFLGRVPSDPALMILSRLNSAALYRSIRELIELAEKDGTKGEEKSFDDQIDDAGEGLGMDLETDLIDQIDGNFGILINRIQLMGADAVAVVQLADPDAFYDTVDGIAGWIELGLGLKGNEQGNQPKGQLSEAEFSGVDYYKLLMPPMLELCFGIVDDHFVVTMSDTRFRSIVSGDGSFVKTLNNDRISKTLDDPTGAVFYVDFANLSRDLMAMAPMIGVKDVEIFEVMGELSELTSLTRLEKEGMVSNMKLTSAKPDVWKRLIAWMLEEAAEDKAGKAAPGPDTD